MRGVAKVSYPDNRYAYRRSILIRPHGKEDADKDAGIDRVAARGKGNRGGEHASLDREGLLYKPSLLSCEKHFLHRREGS
jgi:hypothetical protein